MYIYHVYIYISCIYIYIMYIYIMYIYIYHVYLYISCISIYIKIIYRIHYILYFIWKIYTTYIINIKNIIYIYIRGTHGVGWGGGWHEGLPASTFFSQSLATLKIVTQHLISDNMVWMWAANCLELLPIIMCMYIYIYICCKYNIYIYIYICVCVCVVHIIYILYILYIYVYYIYMYIYPIIRNQSSRLQATSRVSKCWNLREMCCPDCWSCSPVDKANLRFPPPASDADAPLGGAGSARKAKRNERTKWSCWFSREMTGNSCFFDDFDHYTILSILCSGFCWPGFQVRKSFHPAALYASPWWPLESTQLQW